MTENGNDTHRIGILAINLAVVGLCVIVLAAAAVGYNLFSATSPLPTATITLTPRPTLPGTPSSTPTLTPTTTLTPRASLTPTVTSTATQTIPPTITPTPTAFPQLTPARPGVLADPYRLRSWTPEDADLMGRLLQGYPATIAAEGETLAAYYQAFRFAVIAWREALLRFPDAPQAESWRWNLALDLARSGSPDAGAVYARQIAAALNRAEVDLPALYTWLPQREPGLSLLMTDIDPPEGYVASFVMELHSESGSAFIWLLQSPSAYVATPLLTRFDFIRPAQANWIVSELNGVSADGEELAIYFIDPDEEFSVDPPRVFNLNSLPASELPFFPDEAIFPIGEEFENYWVVDESQAGGNRLVFRSTVFPACPTTIELPYAWNGDYFAALSPSFSLQIPSQTVAHCQAVIDYAVSAWGPEAVTSLMQDLEPQWPPAEDIQGEPYPPDARDEFLYRLAIQKALTGDEANAVDLFNQLSTAPAIYNSRWIRPAQRFLAVYQSQDDLYRACIQAVECNPRDAIEYIVAGLSPGANAFEILKQAGVNPAASGYFDFDGDEQAERWFATRYRERQRLEFWILVEHEAGISALPVGPVDGSPPTIETLDEAYIADDGLTRLPAVFLEGRLAFTMKRRPVTHEPYLLPVPLRKEYPSRFFVPLEAAQNVLLAGADPKTTYRDLRALQDFPGMLCAPTWTCDSYYYLLGLAAELSGDERKAVEAYHRLWLDYSRSPFTSMARLKLNAGGEVLNPTPLISSPTVTLTPAPAGTPTASVAVPTATGGSPTTAPTPTTTVNPYAIPTSTPYP